MGTNFYFRFKDKQAKNLWFKQDEYELVDEPDFAYEVHIAKTSIGWKPLFQAAKGYRSVAEMKEAYDSIPGCKIVDEYGAEYTWREFKERVLDFNRSKRCVASEQDVDDTHCISHILYEDPYWPSYKPQYFYDQDGYEFTTGQFS